MKPPICKVCGTEHWSGAPHYSGKPATAAKIDAALTIEGDYRKAKILAASSDAPPENTVIFPAHAASNGQPTDYFPTQADYDAAKKAAAVVAATKRPGRGRPISDAPKSPRAEYQRELMRKRRAAAKEAKP